MQEQRPAELDPELELSDEAFLLVGTGGVVAVEIEPAFADRHDPRVLRQRAQRGDGLRIAFTGVMGVDACRSVKAMLVCNFLRGAALVHGGTCHHDGRDAGIARARDDLVEIAAERGVRQVGPDVDHCSFFRRYRSSSASRGESSSGLSFASSSRSASGEGSGSSGLLRTNKSPCCDDAGLDSSRTWR